MGLSDHQSPRCDESPDTKLYNTYINEKQHIIKKLEMEEVKGEDYLNRIKAKLVTHRKERESIMDRYEKYKNLKHKWSSSTREKSMLAKTFRCFSLLFKLTINPSKMKGNVIYTLFLSTKEKKRHFRILEI